VIAVNTEEESHLHFLDVDVEETNSPSIIKG